MQQFDAAIDKAGGGNDSLQVQEEITRSCLEACTYGYPILGYGDDPPQYCYPQCIVKANILSGQIERNPEEASEIYSQYNSLDTSEKIDLLKKLQARELYKPYTPFFEDNRTSHPKRVMWVIVVVLLVAILFFANK